MEDPEEAPPTKNMKADHKDDFKQKRGLKCPECMGQSLYRDGLRYLADGTGVQRYLCRSCGYRFSESKHKSSNSLDVFRRVDRIHTPSLYLPSRLIFSRQGSHDAHSGAPSALKAAKTLATVENPNKSGLAGATEQTADVKGKILEFLWWMKKQGYAENTITRRGKLLRTLAKRGANLYDPESVKETIAKQECWCSKTKELAVEAYSCFLKMLGETWDPPRFMKVEKLPFIPTYEELSQLIASCNKKVATFLQLLLETGARAGEAWRLTWKDFDFERGIVRITPEKGGKPRALKISQKLIAMLKQLPTYLTAKTPFTGSFRHFMRTYVRNRMKAARKLGNQRLFQITFHTFRHWKATMEYARTKDLLYVKELLGHRNIQSTLIYTQLVNYESNEYIVKRPRTPQEEDELIKVGFEFVRYDEKEQVPIYRKRK